MAERDVEKRHRKAIEDAGGRALKFVSPGLTKVPDRLCLMPIPEHLRATIADYVWFAEIKKPGAKPDAGQRRRHKQFRALGFRVDVIDE